MNETEHRYTFEEDDPANIVKALQEDLSYTMWDVNENNGLCIKLDYTGIQIKIINNKSITNQ